MWSVCLRITDSQHPQGHWAWNRVWAAHQWQQQQSGKVIRQLRQRKDLTAGALLREILVKCQGVWLTQTLWSVVFIPFLFLLKGLVKIRFLRDWAVNLQHLTAIVITYSFSIDPFCCRYKRNGTGTCVYAKYTVLSLQKISDFTNCFSFGHCKRMKENECLVYMEWCTCST